MTIAVLLSGSGRTLANFIQLLAEGLLPVDIRLVISSNPNAGGLEFARKAQIASTILERKGYDSDESYADAIFAKCREEKVDFVVMAGFLKFVPVPEDFMGRVLNIHPALIPSFCGKGMYGHHVHESVLAMGAKVTGVTVHFVDNEYDHGPIIWQQPVPVFENDTPETLANRVFAAELEAYPHVLNLLAAGRIQLDGQRVTIGK